jgi:hypothetical protein
MADKFPLANGVWSNAANWNGGTLPLVGDDVYADGKTVTIDQSVTVLSIRNSLRSGGTVGGTFIISTSGYTITCTDLGIITTVAAASAMQVTATTGVINIISNINGGTSNQVALAKTGACTLNITGNITSGGGTNMFALSISATGGTTSIFGTLTKGVGSNANIINITGSSTLNITGDIFAVLGTGAGISNTVAVCTLNITGNLISGAANVINSNQASTINITGNLTANNLPAVSLTASPTTTVVGTITASNSSVGLNQTGGTVTFSGTAINASNGVMAIYCPNIKLYNANTVEWRFRDELGNVKTLYSAGIALGNPAITNVRSGITYGASLELTGTMIVPSPSNVRISVPTDNTVGTGQLTAADFLAAIAASSDPIAVRLNNVSTVDTSGAQMASYNV